jgi:hypothetical protein
MAETEDRDPVADPGAPTLANPSLRRGRRVQIAATVGGAALAIAAAVSGILGQGIQYRQMRAIEAIAHRCYR